ncbi:MAG: hypothetical protein LBM76_01120 [Mycoplasmataceae bacterium]|jgi:hypothetical protein|nr:hypothetical protein [Mycoplasmataceae bacterium]
MAVNKEFIEWLEAQDNGKGWVKTHFVAKKYKELHTEVVKPTVVYTQPKTEGTRASWKDLMNAKK